MKQNSLQNQLNDITSELPDLIGKMQPQAIDLEKVILGAIMMDKTALAAVKTVFQKSDVFYLQEHRYMTVSTLRLNQNTVLILRSM